MRRSLDASRLVLRLVAAQHAPGASRVASASSPARCSLWTSSQSALGNAGIVADDLHPSPKPSSNLASLLESLGPSPSSLPGPRDEVSSSSPLTVQEEEWDVVRFFPAGIAPPSATKVSAAQLGLAPRDASLLRPPQHSVFSPLAAAAAAANDGSRAAVATAGIGVELGGRASAAPGGGIGGGGGKAAAAWASAAAAAADLGAASPPQPQPSAASASSVLATPVATTQRATLAPRDTMAVPTVPAAAAAVVGGGEKGGEGEGKRDVAADDDSDKSKTSDENSESNNPARSRRLILLRTEAVRAAIGADEAWVFPCRRDADTRSALAAVRAAAEASPLPPPKWYERRGLLPPEALLLSSSSSSSATDRHAMALTFPPGRTPFFSEDGNGDAPATNVVAASSSHQQPSPLPFELAVLEALLSETVRQFERRHRQLRLLATGVEDDIGRTLRKAGGAGDVASSSELQRLLPIARALTAMAHDVREARAAVAEVADSDRLLAAVCLSDEVELSSAAAVAEEKAGGIEEEEAKRRGGGVEDEGERRRRLSSPSPFSSPSSSSSSSSPLSPLSSKHARAAAALFESYERQLQSVEGALRELEEGLESARAVWSMTLAAQRNRIINLNLRLTVLTFSTAVACATPAAFFGMNLRSGLEEVPGLFWPVAGWSVAGAAALGLGVHALLRWWPDAAHRKRLADLGALRDLLIHHLDDLDAISAAVVQSKSSSGEAGDAKLGKQEFAAAVARAGVWMLPGEVDLLFRVYDSDSSGFLEVSEVVAAHDRAAAGR